MNLNALNQSIEDSGITIISIANKIGISRQQLYKKLSGEVEFKVSEANLISDILRLTKKEKDEIFFAE